MAPKPIDPAACKWAQPYGVIGYTAARQSEASEINGLTQALSTPSTDQLETDPGTFFSKPTKLDEIWRQRAERTKGAPAKTARVLFAKELFEKYGTYCWLELWTPEPMRVPGADSSPPPPPQRLLEVFEERNSLFFHPSRNPFHVAAGTELREALHSLAISPAMKMSRAKRKPKH